MTFNLKVSAGLTDTPRVGLMAGVSDGVGVGVHVLAGEGAGAGVSEAGSVLDAGGRCVSLDKAVTTLLEIRVSVVHGLNGSVGEGVRAQVLGPVSVGAAGSSPAPAAAGGADIQSAGLGVS